MIDDEVFYVSVHDRHRNSWASWTRTTTGSSRRSANGLGWCRTTVDRLVTIKLPMWLGSAARV